MRRSFSTAALLAALAVAACTDTAPTGPRIRPGDAGPLLATETVGGYTDRLIPRLFPKGLETATGQRWSTVKDKRQAGDIEGAAKHMRDLAKYVKLKTPEIENLEVAGDPVKFASKEQAAASLSYAMAVYVHKGETAEAPQTGGDVAFEVVPAGQAAIVVTPSERAAVDIPAGATSEDRLITIIQHPNEAFPGHCNGPLPTNLCQYPLFYDISSFPSLDFNTRIAVSVCAVTAGDRSPLDNPALPPPDNEAVHHRLALARPYTGGAQTDGGKVIGQIEVLPARRLSEQKGLTTCDNIPTPVALATPRGGLLGRAQRGMLALANLAGRMLTPKNLYAIDSGPEHWTIGLGSPVNAVDTASAPDVEPVGFSAPESATAGSSITVSYAVQNTSPVNGGAATARSDTVFADVVLSMPAGEGSVTTADVQLDRVKIPPLRPDERWPAEGSLSRTIEIPLSAEVVNVPTTYTIAVVLSPSGDGLPDVSLENNVVSREIVVDPRPADLTVVAGPTMSRTDLVVGGTLDVSWTARNIGFRGSGTFPARFFVSTDDQLSSDDVPLEGNDFIHASLLAGASHTVSGLQRSLPPTLGAGTYWLFVRLDPDNAITELDETNNTSQAVAFTLVDPGPVTPISSSLLLVAHSSISRPESTPIAGTDNGGMTQGATLNPLNATVSAVAEFEGMSVTTVGQAAASWQDAANGRIVFTHVGWTSTVPAQTGFGASVINGTDWTYTFRAGASGTFTLNYDVTVDAGSTGTFGLVGFWFSWREGTGTPPLTQLLEPGQTGSLTKEVVAGRTYTVRVENQANIGASGPQNRHQSGTFSWSIK